MASLFGPGLSTGCRAPQGPLGIRRSTCAMPSQEGHSRLMGRAWVGAAE